MTLFLARLTLPLSLLCAALLAMTLIGARLLPAPPQSSFLSSNPCALPCLYDVIPGATTRNDAMVIYERLGYSYSFLSPTFPSVYTVHQSSSASTILAMFNFGIPSGTYVSSVQLYQMASDRNFGTLSDFLLAGYQPKRVLSACENTRRIVLTFSDQPLFLQILPADTFTLDAAVMLVGTAVDTDAMTRSMRGFGCTAQSDWHGFAARWQYQAADS